MIALIALFPVFGSDRQMPSLFSIEDKKDGVTSALAVSSQFDYSHDSVPAFSRRQIKKMLVQAAKNLPLVETPLLILQAAAAAKADHQNAYKYLEKIASSEKELLFLSDPDLESLTIGTSLGGRALADFILRYCRQ